MSPNTNISVRNFLVNDDFIDYVLNPTFSLTEKWAEFFRMHPNQIPVANEARNILLGYVDKKMFPNHESIELKARIFEKCGLSSLN